MHQQASTSSCSGRVVDAHSIQRKGPLARIVGAANHVSRLEPSKDGSAYVVNDIGWKRASVFPGYCSAHDSALFRPLEETAFIGEHEHCVLQAFRNICNELYRKNALLESFMFQRDHVDLVFWTEWDRCSSQQSVNCPTARGISLPAGWKSFPSPSAISPRQSPRLRSNRSTWMNTRRTKTRCRLFSVVRLPILWRRRGLSAAPSASMVDVAGPVLHRRLGDSAHRLFGA